MKTYHLMAAAAALLTLTGGCAGFSNSAPKTPIQIAEAKVAHDDDRLQDARNDLRDARKDLDHAEQALEKAEDRVNRARRDEAKAARQMKDASRDFNAARIGLGETLEEEGVPGSSPS
ncbi:hypothetical protein WNY37_06310 [Henriciella sp. AS95]|uniref:hypothetical protein n=1 Tax=Henriciella sp. AS95 TaxID=3135782 RepID=UPI00317CF417